MVRMVKVLESNGPTASFLAEVPGHKGQFVLAGTLPELRTRLRIAMADLDGTRFTSSSAPDGSRFASSVSIELNMGLSDTALYVSV